MKLFLTTATLQSSFVLTEQLGTSVNQTIFYSSYIGLSIMLDFIHPLLYVCYLRVTQNYANVASNKTKKIKDPIPGRTSSHAVPSKFGTLTGYVTNVIIKNKFALHENISWRKNLQICISR